MTRRAVFPPACLQLLKVAGRPAGPGRQTPSPHHPMRGDPCRPPSSARDSSGVAENGHFSPRASVVWKEMTAGFTAGRAQPKPRAFMRGVTTGELPQRLRKFVARPVNGEPREQPSRGSRVCGVCRQGFTRGSVVLSAQRAGGQSAASRTGVVNLIGLARDTLGFSAAVPEPVNNTVATSAAVVTPSRPQVIWTARGKATVFGIDQVVTETFE